MMNKVLSITAKAAAVLYTSGAAAAQFPTFELTGFPISPHQVSLVGSAHVQERPPTPILTLGGMPASPHQIVVLSPRHRATDGQIVSRGERTTTGAFRVSPVVAIEAPR